MRVVQTTNSQKAVLLKRKHLDFKESEICGIMNTLSFVALTITKTLSSFELDPQRLKYLSFFAFFSISNVYVIRSYMLVSRL